MKKVIVKRIISLLVVFVLLFSLTLVSNAAKDKDEDVVATLTFFCCVKSPGHVWIYVENLSDETLKLGAYNLLPGDGVSVGTFGFTRYDGWGIYYNVEAYCQTKYSLKSYSTLTEELTMDEINTLSDGISSHSNKWSVFNNCVNFAVGMWNRVSDKKLGAFMFPAIVRIQLLLRGCDRNTPIQKAVTADQVFKQRGRGEEAYLEVVSSASLGNIW